MCRSKLLKTSLSFMVTPVDPKRARMETVVPFGALAVGCAQGIKRATIV